jgi:hypothetical protein
VNQQEEEDDEMMEELQRQSNMDLNIPEHIPEKLMTLNQLFDVHRTPLK